MAQGDKPVKEFRAGGVRASIWRDEVVGQQDEPLEVFSVRVEKRETLRRFRGHNILLALPERSLRDGAEPGPSVIVYKTAIKVEPVLSALETVRARGRQ